MRSNSWKSTFHKPKVECSLNRWYVGFSVDKFIHSCLYTLKEKFFFVRELVSMYSSVNVHLRFLFVTQASRICMRLGNVLAIYCWPMACNVQNKLYRGWFAQIAVSRKKRKTKIKAPQHNVKPAHNQFFIGIFFCLDKSFRLFRVHIFPLMFTSNF